MASFAKPKSFGSFLWLYFGTGLVLGVIIGCAITLAFVFSSLTATNYYYYYDGKTYRIHTTMPEVGSNGQIIEGKWYGPSRKLPPQLKGEEEEEEEERVGPGYDKERLSHVHKYIRGFPVHGLTVLLLIEDRCDLLIEQTYLETWGSSVTLFLIVNSKCPILKREPQYWRNVTLYTYTDNDLNLYQLLHKTMQVSDSDWTLFVSPDTYVNVLHVSRLLSDYNSNHRHMFGKCNHRGPGLLLSKSVIKDLILNGRSCLHINNGDDIILTVSRCCTDTLNMYCSPHIRMTDNFKDKDIDSLLTDEFTNSFVIHPIKTSQTIIKIHRHFALKRYNQTRVQMDHLLVIVKQLTASKYHNNLKQYAPHEYPLQDKFQNGQEWLYFDSNYIYSGLYLNVRIPLSGIQNELNTVLLEALRLANKDYHAPLIFNKMINGYLLRTEDGTRYVVDVEFQEVSYPHTSLLRRFTLFRPFQLSFLNFPSKSIINEVVHMIVPVNDVGPRLEKFFEMFERIIVDLEDKIHLILVVYNRKDMNECQEFVTKYQNKYSILRFTIVQAKGQFSRARALDAGTAILDEHHLMFFCDVDLDIGKEFFERCKRNTVRHKQVYFPEVFKMYNMNYVYKFGLKPKFFETNRKNGHWGHYGYGMLCMYKSDYVKVGRLDTNYVGWGGEDVNFHNRVSEGGYSMLRAPDPALKHPWHNKVCDSLDRTKRGQCLNSRNEVVADRRELGRYIYEMELNKSHLFCI